MDEFHGPMQCIDSKMTEFEPTAKTTVLAQQHPHLQGPASV